MPQNCHKSKAETLNKYVKKGNPLCVEGRPKYDQWEAQDGSKGSKLRVIVENFQFLGGRDSGASQTVVSQWSQQATAPSP